MARRSLKSVAACGVAAALVLVLAAPAAADSSGRPFKGWAAGEAQFNPVSVAVCPPGGPLFGGLRTEGYATGRSTHLGPTTFVSLHCTPSGDAITGGVLTLTAANGDEVWIEYSGSAPFPGPGTTTIVVTLTFDIVGGTGRFAGATGGGDLMAWVAFEGFGDPAWAATWAWDGMIGY
jgi:hypothetical protein